MDTETADAFATAPFSPKEIRFQIAGAVLNGIIWIAGLAWLIINWTSVAPRWPWIVLAVLAGIYAADLVSGLLHWAFDTWFNEDIPFLRRMVVQVREHHVYPNRIFRYHFLHDAGTLSWLAMALAVPTIFLALLLDAGALVIAAAVFDILLVGMLSFHKIGHRARQPRWILLLQKSRIMISAAHHSQHHGGNHDFNYCLINGWADHTLGRAGFFRFLEWAIARATGAEPRRNDHEWLRRFASIMRS